MGTDDQGPEPEQRASKYPEWEDIPKLPQSIFRFETDSRPRWRERLRRRREARRERRAAESR